MLRSIAGISMIYDSLVFNAAGNDSVNIPGNADSDKLIVVGATGQNDQKTSWSSYGDFVDIMAPGERVTSCGVPTNRDRSYYSYVSGTSFSCPFAAGLAALIWSANPKLTANEVEQVMKDSADPKTGSVHGRINSYQALTHSLIGAEQTCADETDCYATQYCDGSNDCQGCDSSCATCSGASTTCTSCSPGKYLTTSDDTCQTCFQDCDERMLERAPSAPKAAILTVVAVSRAQHTTKSVYLVTIRDVILVALVTKLMKKMVVP